MQEVIALRSGESEFYALVKGTSAGLGAVAMLNDLGVNISKNTKIDKAALEVRVDASPGRGIAVRRGRDGSSHCYSNIANTKSSRNIAKNTKIPGVSNPADLGTKYLDGASIRRKLERYHCYIREGRLESCCEQKSRNLILKFSLLTMLVKLTLSRKGKWSRNSIDYESSDAVKLKQLRDHMV